MAESRKTNKKPNSEQQDNEEPLWHLLPIYFVIGCLILLFFLGKYLQFS